MLIIIVSITFWSCCKKTPLDLTHHELSEPNSYPTIDTSVLTDGVDFSVGYYNGNIRTDRVSLDWAASTDADFLCYNIFREEGEPDYSFEGFEGGSLPGSWTTYGDFGGWYVTNQNSYEGNYCARSYSGNYGYEYLETTINVAENSYIFISFWAYGSTDGEGSFRINGSTQDYWYDYESWDYFTFYYYTGSYSSITLEWRYYTGYYGYGLIDNVEVEVFEEGNRITQLETIIDKNLTTFTDMALTQNQYYTYKIASIVEQGTHKIDEVQIKTPKWLAPDSIDATGLSSTIVELSWLDNSESETAFVILVDTLDVDSQVYINMDSLEVDKNVTNKIISNLDNEHFYQFRVRATNDWEDDTPEIESNPFMILFEPPSDLFASQMFDSKSVFLEWTDQSSIENGFDVERKINSEDFTKIAQVEKDITEYTDNDTTEFEYGDTITYRIRAFNDYEEIEYTEYSNEEVVVLSEMNGINDDFEMGIVQSYWETYGNWYITDEDAFESNYSIRCPSSYYETYHLEATLDVPEYTYITISFYTREGDTSGDGDLYINGYYQLDWDGGYNWFYRYTTYYTGENSQITLQWEYDTGSYGYAYLDNIQVTW